MRRLLWAMVAAMLIVGCNRQNLMDNCCETTTELSVKVNWEQSGITPSRSLDEEDPNFVHRVSFRFYPTNGEEPFERYLEGNVHEGVINVPYGTYNVLVMNESVYDIYWQDYIGFSDIENYKQILATAVKDSPAGHEYYEYGDDEVFMKHIPKISSWSVENFVVEKPYLQKNARAETDNYMLVADMRRLTYECRVVVELKNLKSAMEVRTAMKGMSNKRFLWPAETDEVKGTNLLRLTRRSFTTETDGTVEVTFRSFGKPLQDQTYKLQVDVVLTDGTKFTPTDPKTLIFDVSDQLQRQTGPDYEVRVAIELPEVSDGIEVGEWEDDEYYIN